MRTRTSEEGWALISVLYVVTMLAILAAAVQALLLTSAQLDRRAWEWIEADAALDAIVTRAVLGITDQRLDQRWRVDGTDVKFIYDDQMVHVRVQDQLGLIDLNAADGSMIRRLLLACGTSEDDASTLTDNILDWRTSTGIGRLKSASDALYVSAGRTHLPRHGPFQSVAELRLVLGITPELFRKMEPALTVYNGHPAFEPSSAPELALRALYLERPDEVTRLLAERMPSSGNLLGWHPAVLSPSVPLGGRSFEIAASVQVGARSYKRRTIIMLTEDSKKPFLTLAWD